MEKESFMDLLGSEEGKDHLFSPPSCLSSPSSSSSCYSSSKSAQMLWFGGKEEDAVAVLYGVPQISTDSSLSSPSSSPPSTTISTCKSPNKTKMGRGRRTTSVTATKFNTTKKPKTAGSSCPGTIMVRKDKLGERIMALQQLVSPFGKSDTASVLHEALGYIRFLHDQVQEGREKNDLRSRGLCLVPVASTEHVARSNGADLWSPAAHGK
ncbi:transcription factor bHLH113-like isoform X2 [Musa acuminata AAA Group]|uniref:transcription factor bHLH113-like isoform X2 n=1 Tax=Musa acuminata AAA Group TaxID=214697 RepID=UPI0031E22B91